MEQIARFLFFLICLLIHQLALASDTLIAKHSFWKYQSDSVDLGMVWRNVQYPDSNWKTGQAAFGYGMGNENTLLDFGTDPNDKFITTYFRKKIQIDSSQNYQSYSFKVKRDDGFVLYVNGNEVFRNNMGLGFIYYSSLAIDAKDEGMSDIKFTLPDSIFQNGENTLAVELHQYSAFSYDALFDLELLANHFPVITRGPYLQKVNPQSVTVRWKTNEISPSILRFGLSPNSLTSAVKSITSTTDHSILVDNLLPNTRYYYSIDSVEMDSFSIQNQYFTTFKSPNSQGKTRIWATGDCGNASKNQILNMQQQQAYLNGEAADVWLLLGDNAYESGYDYEYQSKFFDIFSPILPHTPLYPAPGNHEYASNSDRQNDHAIAYYDIFSLPSQGESGGIPSGTPAYYAFNNGDIHFISLDSYGREDSLYRMYDTLSAQVQWLKQDLAASPQKWKIAYWHHPPYTKGSHNSDTEDELVQIRQNLIRILERYGVDLILCGHSHSYERSMFLSGYYGDAASFDAEKHTKSTSTAHYDGTQNSCPYIKKGEGTVYVVTGSAGKVGGFQSDFPHPAMSFSDVSNGGSLMIEIEDNRLDAKWLCADGQIRDNFTIMKNVARNDTIPVGFGHNIQLQASWQGQYLWENGTTNSTTSFNFQHDSVLTVSDGLTCLEDTFVLQLPMSHSIDIENFRANALASHKVILDWDGKNAQDFDHFVVERSLDKLRFTAIGQVAKTNISHYDFLDTNAPSGLVYYRIRALDSQHAGYTNLPIAVYLYKTEPLISFYPNPLSKKDLLNIRILSSDSESLFEVEIIDEMGRILMEKSPLLKGTDTKLLQLQTISTGFYYIKIYNEEKIWTEKVFIY